MANDMEYVVLVDGKDREIGVSEKSAVHQFPFKLHRAFSIFILNDQGHLLIQKRNREKKTWPGYWSNSCCSHPRPQEPIELAGRRRLQEELGFTCDIKFLFKFQYTAQYDQEWGEHELDHVFLGYHNGAVYPNSLEVDTFDLVPLDNLQNDLVRIPSKFTPWLRKCFGMFRQHIRPVGS